MPRGSVVLFGYGPFGAAGVDALANLGALVQAVVVPGNRTGHDVDVVRSRSAFHGIPVKVQPSRASLQPFVDELRADGPDLIVVCSYTMLVPDAALAVPKRGAVNVHGGLLPQYRGPHVMQWAIINGERETGVTLHYMDGGFDTGPIIAQRAFPIGSDDDAVVVRNCLIEAGCTLLAEWWDEILDGTAPRVPQDESRARYWPKRGPEDGAIDWSAPAASIVNLVRALVAPWPGAFTRLDHRRLVVRAARVGPAHEGGSPGRILSVGPDGVVVATGRDQLVIGQLECEGRPVDLRSMAACAGAAFSTQADALRDA